MINNAKNRRYERLSASSDSKVVSSWVSQGPVLSRVRVGLLCRNRDLLGDEWFESVPLDGDDDKA